MAYNIQEEIESLVREAAFFVHAQGEDAFPLFRTEGRFLYKDIYVFVWVVRGNRVIRLVFPPDNMGEDIEITDMTDSSGTNITEMIMKIANSRKGEGWSEPYQWKKPRENIDSRKISFVKSVINKGRMYVVGAGYYLT
ncbi:MAG TPA: cache domain-containing protein [Methanofastidiosum sp.]|nr:cache domain-containing protein [Methanofastidiosum sp.]